MVSRGHWVLNPGPHTCKVSYISLALFLAFILRQLHSIVPVDLELTVQGNLELVILLLQKEATDGS